MPCDRLNLLPSLSSCWSCYCQPVPCFSTMANAHLSLSLSLSLAVILLILRFDPISSYIALEDDQST